MKKNSRVIIFALFFLLVLVSCDQNNQQNHHKKISSISVKRLPDKIEYLPTERFDSSGMTVLLSYSNGSTEVSDIFVTNPIDGSILSTYPIGVIPVTVFSTDMKVSTSFNIIIDEDLAFEKPTLLYATAVQNNDYKSTMVSGGDDRLSYFIFKLGSIKNLLLEEPQYFYHGGGTQSLTDISSITSSKAIETTTEEASQQTIKWENEASASYSAIFEIGLKDVIKTGAELCLETSVTVGGEETVSLSESFTKSYEYSVTKSQSRLNGFTDSSAKGWWLVGFRGNVDVYAVVVVDNKTKEMILTTVTSVTDTFFTQEYLGKKNDISIFDNIDAKDDLRFDCAILNDLYPLVDYIEPIVPDVILYYANKETLLIDLSDGSDSLNKLSQDEFNDGVLQINREYWGIDCETVVIEGAAEAGSNSTIDGLSLSFTGNWDPELKIILNNYSAVAPIAKAALELSELPSSIDTITITAYGKNVLVGGNGNNSQLPGVGINAYGKDLALIISGEDSSLVVQGASGSDGSLNSCGQNGATSILADTLALTGKIDLYGGNGGKGGKGLNGNNGRDAWFDSDRTDGEPGKNGGTGGNGAKAIDSSSTALENAILTLKPGDGGNGGNGGNGGKGGTNTCFVVLLVNGSSGGKGGDGGNGGNVYVPDTGLNFWKKVNSSITRIDGTPGTGGNGGTGGQKGDLASGLAVNNPQDGRTGNKGASGTMI